LDLKVELSHRVRVEVQLSEEVRVKSIIPQRSVLDPKLSPAYVNGIWINIETNKRLLADNCVIYRKIMDNSDIDMLQTDLNRLGEWTVENEMKYIQSSKRVSFRKTWVKERIRYYFGDQLIPEVSTFNI